MDLSRCVFHLRTPANAHAEALMPLSVLREQDPAAFAQAIAKYDDTPERRRLPGTTIPHTDATWIDVVFLTPIQPHAIWTAWQEITGKALPPHDFWAIPIGDLPSAFLFARTSSTTGEPIDDREVSRIVTGEYTSSPATTAGNREWLADLARRGRRGAWFHRTPHVLVPGTVPLTGAGIIDWQDA